MIRMESHTKKQIKEYLRSIGAYYTSPPGGAYGTNGTPDIIACVNGRFVGIEGKYAYGEQSGWQEGRQNKIEKAGGIYIVAYSVEHVRDVIEREIL